MSFPKLFSDRAYKFDSWSHVGKTTMSRMERGQKLTQSIGRRYFIVGEVARSEGEVVRIAALLRGTESAWQALSYGLNAIPIFAQVGGVYLNFSLWFLALVPAWLVIRKIGVSLGDSKVDRDEQSDKIANGVLDAADFEKKVVSMNM